ncbi:MAG: DUF423 domain-containing protein [Bacteroidia bacterium]|nr:DUF423 domain-containing protein [Bacteroidia bacterium]
MENTLPKNKLIVIGLLGAIAVSLGALGAHFLKSKLETGLITPDLLNGFDTAVKYQMYHVIGMLLLVVLAKLYPSKYFNWAYNLFFVGILLFSGSLYFLCTRHLLGADWLKFLGPITPIGGICFVLGWLCLCLAVLKSDKKV